MEGSEIVRSEPTQLSRANHNPWTRERVDLVKRTICPKGIGDDEFALFMEQCKRSGLDPLLKEAFCVPRRQRVGEQWVAKHEFQPSEAGMLARAERFPDFKGIQASAAYAEDELLIDQGKGEVVHRFNPAKRKGQLVGAWARVVRDGKLPVVVWLDFAGYVQQTPLWSKIPTTMIEKCARVAALRKAYPEAFGGLYIREEMPAEDSEPQAPHARPSLEMTVTVEDQPPSEAQQRWEKRDAVAALKDDLLSFGPFKGQLMSALSLEELGQSYDVAMEKLEADAKEIREAAEKEGVEKKPARWVGALKRQLGLIEQWRAKKEREAEEKTKQAAGAPA